jgi:hypothetical protein
MLEISYTPDYFMTPVLAFRLLKIPSPNLCSSTSYVTNIYMIGF